MTLTYEPGKKYKGKVTFIYPYLSPKTRTVQRVAVARARMKVAAPTHPRAIAQNPRAGCHSAGKAGHRMPRTPAVMVVERRRIIPVPRR